jgi:hypothetical protein
MNSKVEAPRYSVWGHFYSASIGGAEYQFRSILEIRSQEAKEHRPDLLVVMMNPGGSRPLEKDIEVPKWEVGSKKTSLLPTKEDRTQMQIMKLMDMLNFDFARIINLSDIREPKSENFHKLVQKFGNDMRHSIFAPARRSELDDVMHDKDIPVLAAWGLGTDLNLATRAEQALAGRNIIGLRPTPKPMYRHPLPQNATAQKQWLKDVSELFAKQKRKKSS